MRTYSEAIEYLNMRHEGIDWTATYTEERHKEIVDMLESETKLAATKSLKDVLGIGLKESLNFANYISDDLGTTDGQMHPDHREETTLELQLKEPENLVDAVAELINDEIQDDYSMTGLCQLLAHVPEHILRDYYKANS